MEPDVEQLAADLDARVTRFWHLVLRGSFRELSRTSASVLAQLRDGGAQRVTDLAAAEAVAQPTMTTLVGRLEREGLVQRAADPGDGRVVLVSITQAGLDLLTRAGDARRAIVQERLAALDDADRAALTAALPAFDRLIRS